MVLASIKSVYEESKDKLSDFVDDVREVDREQVTDSFRSSGESVKDTMSKVRSYAENYKINEIPLKHYGSDKI